MARALRGPPRTSARRPGRRRLRVALDAGEPVMIDARLVQGRTTLVSKRFERVDRGRSALELALRRGTAGRARLVLDVTDAFGNTRTLRRTIRLGARR